MGVKDTVLGAKSCDKDTVNQVFVEERLKIWSLMKTPWDARQEDLFSCCLRIKLPSIFTFMLLKLFRHRKNNQNATRGPEH